MRQLRAVLIDALEGPAALTPHVLTKVENCATLRVCAELARQSFLSDGNTTAEDLVRLENLVARSERALGLSKPSTKPAAPTLADYLRNREGQT